MGCEFHRFGIATDLTKMPVLDTCTETTALLLKLPGGRGGKFKLPTLTELHEYLFNEKFAEAHNATADVEATTRCFLELVKRGNFNSNELPLSEEYYTAFRTNNLEVKPIGLKHVNLKQASDKLTRKITTTTPKRY
jgi:DNA polymerase III subunit alpha